MRKLVVICIGISLVLAACVKQKAETTRAISLGASEKSISCPVQFGTCEFYIFADEYINSREFTPISYQADIIGGEGWLTFTDNGAHRIIMKGSGILSLDFDSNSGLRRSAKVVLKSDTRTDTLRVKQEGPLREFVRLVGEYPVVPAEGGTFQSRIETNVLPSSLHVTGSEGVTDWELNHNVVTFTIGPSTSRDRRNITLTVYTIDGWEDMVSGSVTLQQEPGK